MKPSAGASSNCSRWRGESPATASRGAWSPASGWRKSVLWPAAGIAARLTAPAAHLLTRVVEPDGRRADERGVREDLEVRFVAALDRVDALLEDGTLTTDPPNAAALQVLASVALLSAMADLHDQIASRPCGIAAEQLFPDYPGPIPRCLPQEWLRELAVAPAA